MSRLSEKYRKDVVPVLKKEFGIENPLDLAAALWSASPDVRRMTKIILEWKGLGRAGAK